MRKAACLGFGLVDNSGCWWVKCSAERLASKKGTWLAFWLAKKTEWMTAACLEQQWVVERADESVVTLVDLLAATMALTLALHMVVSSAGRLAGWRDHS